MIDLTDYKTASRLSPQINRGCSDRLSGKPMFSPYTETDHDLAYVHGWETADASERKAGRPMPRPMSEFERQEAIAEWMNRLGHDLHDPAQADRLDSMAGRVGGVISPPCSHCGGGPVHCRHCQVPA